MFSTVKGVIDSISSSVVTFDSKDDTSKSNYAYIEMEDGTIINDVVAYDGIASKLTEMVEKGQPVEIHFITHQKKHWAIAVITDERTYLDRIFAGVGVSDTSGYLVYEIVLWVVGFATLHAIIGIAFLGGAIVVHRKRTYVDKILKYIDSTLPVHSAV